MVAVSLDGEMVNVCVCIPISTPTISGISQFFSGKKVTASPKSEGARTLMSFSAVCAHDVFEQFFRWTLVSNVDPSIKAQRDAL